MTAFLSSMVWKSGHTFAMRNTLCLDLEPALVENVQGPFFYLCNYLGIQFLVNSNCFTLSGQKSVLLSRQMEGKACFVLFCFFF